MRLNESIGRKIAKARTEAGLSLEQLAASLNITTETLLSYEAGRERVIPAHLSEISVALNLPIVDLVDSVGALPQKSIKTETWRDASSSGHDSPKNISR